MAVRAIRQVHLHSTVTGTLADEAGPHNGRRPREVLALAIDHWMLSSGTLTRLQTYRAGTVAKLKGLLQTQGCVTYYFVKAAPAWRAFILIVHTVFFRMLMELYLNCPSRSLYSASSPYQPEICVCIRSRVVVVVEAVLGTTINT